jgi:DNA-directed RNA polymerase I, II, and III subunit RPABC2
MEHPVYMTKFEKARIIGERATQIAKGAPSTVDITGMVDATAIAEKELKERTLPLKITRIYPDGKTRTFSVAEMLCD